MKKRSHGVSRALALLGIFLASIVAPGGVTLAQNGPVIAVEPAAIDFGSAAAGTQYSSEPVILRNNGNRPLTVYAMQLVGANPDDFRLIVAGFPFTVGAGDLTAFALTFAPTSLGAKSALLRIVSDDPTNGILDIALSGNGVGIETLGYATAGVVTSSSTAVPNTQVGIAVLIDMTNVNPPGSLIRAYHARLSWDPDVLVYAGFDPLVQMGDLPVAVGTAPEGTGTIDWYGAALSSGGAGGIVQAITFSFVVIGGVGATTPLDLEILELESDSVEDLLPNLTVVDNVLQVVSNGTPPDIVVEPTALDYDSVTVGATATQQLVITNEGVEDLVISNIIAEGTDAEQFTVDGGAPFTLIAGASQALAVNFAPTTSGVKNATLRIDNNDPDEDPSTVALTGEGVATAVPDIYVDPAAHDFGQMAVDESATQTFTIINEGLADLEVETSTFVGEAASQFAITSGGAPFTVPAGDSHAIVVQFNPDDPGIEKTLLRLTNNDPGEDPVDIAMSTFALFEGDIMVTPLALNFGDVVLGSLVAQNITVRNEGNLPFQVISIGLSGGPQNDFSFGPNDLGYIQPGENATISINFVPVSAGAKSGKLSIYSEDSDEKLIEVNLNGTGIAVPDILVQPTSHSYGSVSVGDSATQSFALRNVGTADLNIQAPTLVGTDASHFAVTNGNGATTLSMGETSTVAVDFTPTSSGTKNATLRLNNNDPGENPTNIPLNGSGSGTGGGNEPTVSITEPSNGALVSGLINVSATAENVAQVEFFIDGGSIGVDTTAPYGLAWDTTTVGDGNHTVSAEVTNGGQTANDSVSVTVNNQPGTNDPLIYVSSSSNGNAGNVGFADEDILVYDTGTSTWSIFLDGSDVGLGGSSARDIDAFFLMDDGSILLSIVGNSTISGLGAVDDSDIVRFVPTSLGANSAGSFEWYFDGSDVGLSTNGEDLNAVSLLPDGRLLISTLNSFNVPGASGRDEDLIIFTPVQLGSTTSGTWELYFDGSDVGLTGSTEEVWGLWRATNNDLYLSPRGSFSVSGVSGDGADIFICIPGGTGTNTSCAFQPFWDGSAHGFGGENIDGFSIDDGLSVVTSRIAAEDQFFNEPVDPDDDPTNGDRDDEIEEEMAEQQFLPIIVR